MDTMLYLLAFVVVLLAQSSVTSAYQKYKQVQNERGVTGAQVARRIL